MAHQSFLLVILVAVAQATSCPRPQVLDELLMTSSPAELGRLLSACAELADQQRTLITAAQAVLESGEATGLAAAARAVLKSGTGSFDGADSPVSLAPVTHIPQPVPPRPAGSVTAQGPAKVTRKQRLPTYHESVKDQQAAQLAQALLVAERQKPSRSQTGACFGLGSPNAP